MSIASIDKNDPKYYPLMIIQRQIIPRKNKLVKIDPIDAKIIMALQDNADRPAEVIGDLVGLSRNACWKRMKSLEAQGILKHRIMLANAQALGYNLTVFIHVKTNDHSRGWNDIFMRAIATIPQIQKAYRMSGDLDYLLQAIVPDIGAYDDMYQELTRRVPLSDVSASFVMEEIKNTTVLPLQ